MSATEAIKVINRQPLHFVLLFGFVLLINFKLFASSNIKYGGARAAGLGQSVVSMPEAGYFQNQALLTHFDSLYIEVYSSLSFAIKELGTHSLFAALPVLGGVSSIQYQYFGYTNYNENRMGLAYARKLTKNLSLGVQIGWLRTGMPAPYGAYNNFIAEVGLSYRLSKRLIFGAHVFNPTQSKLVKDTDEIAHTAIRAGVAYYPIDALAYSFEIVQFLNQKISFRTGLDLSITQYLNVRTGYNHDNKTICFGVGANLKVLSINMALGYHNVLGYTPHISLGKQF
ncbi:MAG TPA: hypothetical protein PKW37_05075 [Salinivirgaceae bacterium]|nr:hypothetical protein [Salinivirgaceae bacterium]